MMKVLNILIIVALSLFVVACTAPPSDIPVAQVEDVAQQKIEMIDDMVSGEEVAIDLSTSTFEFEGYAVGKSNIGTFDTWSGNLMYNTAGKLIGGNVLIQADTVNTGIEGLDTHLKSDDFFDAEVYPEISVDILEVGTTALTAELTFRGVSKTITFPITQVGQGITTDFRLDTTDFAMKNAGVNKEVRIAFEVYPTQ